MSYPKEIIVRRLSNELKECSEYLGTEFDFDGSKMVFPLEIKMTLSNVLGYESADKVITDHRFKITITEDYGQAKPQVEWLSHIFHPNIMDPDDGGKVCLKLLNEWSYGTHLLSFLKSIETLVSEPNPYSAFGTESCIAAAEYFSNNKTKFNATIGDK